MIENWTDLATVLAPAVAVLLAFIGWSFRPKREIHIKQDAFALINPPQNSDDFDLIVRHREEDISQPVFSSFVIITNIGNRDISSDDFVEPLKVTTPDKYYVLSCRYGAPKGVKLEKGEDTATKINIKWNLLKPKQQVVLKIILTRNDENYANPDEQRLSYTVLLKDVRANFGSYRVSPYLRLGRYYLWIIFFTALTSALITPIKYDKAVFLNTDEQEVVLIRTEGEQIEWCEVLTSPVSIEKCYYTPISELKNYDYKTTKSVRWRAPLPLSSFTWFILLFSPPFFVFLDYRKSIIAAARKLTKLRAKSDE